MSHLFLPIEKLLTFPASAWRVDVWDVTFKLCNASLRGNTEGVSLGAIKCGQSKCGKYLFE